MALVINGTKFSGRMLKTAVSQYLAHRKNAKQRKSHDGVTPCGKQSVKQLIKQNQGVSNFEVTDPSIRGFDRIARKYGVDYAIKRDRTSDPPRFLVFFKSRDADALTSAFQEYSRKKVKKAERPSVLEKLAQFKTLVTKPIIDREKRKEHTR